MASKIASKILFGEKRIYTTIKIKMLSRTFKYAKPTVFLLPKPQISWKHSVESVMNVWVSVCCSMCIMWFSIFKFFLFIFSETIHRMLWYLYFALKTALYSPYYSRICTGYYTCMSPIPQEFGDFLKFKLIK